MSNYLISSLDLMRFLQIHHLSIIDSSISVNHKYLSGTKTNENRFQNWKPPNGNKQTCSAERKTKSDASSGNKTSHEKHNGHKKNTTKNQFRLNIYLSNKPLNIPLICASGARERSEMDERPEKASVTCGRFFFVGLFFIFASAERE